MPELEHIDDGLHRIGLPPEPGWPDTVSRTVNVYCIEGETPTLVNAGHPSQRDDLADGLDELGLAPADIERIVATSWRIDVLGGATELPDADLFVYSPDMVLPRHYEAQVENERESMREYGRALVETGEFDASAMDRIEEVVADYLPPVDDQLDFIPCRSDQVLRLGPLECEAVEAPGTGVGHIALHLRNRDALFTGDVSLKGLPNRLYDVRSYLVSIERLVEFELDEIYPNHGEARRFGERLLRSSLSFVNNFMSNVPSALYGEPTLLEFVERNLGRRPDDFADVVYEIRLYRRMLNELARSQMIQTEGSGLERRYGTDVEDPREDIRQL